jgi:hypothetical protein
MRSDGTVPTSKQRDLAFARAAPFSHTHTYQYLKRLDDGTALIDVRHLDPQKTWLGVPVQGVMLWPNPSEWTGVFGVNLYLYRGIWICSCWIEGKPGYHKHPLNEDWLEQVTFWEVTEVQARRWFEENHQPIPDKLKGVESGTRAATNNQPGHPAPPAGPPVGPSPSVGSDGRTEATAGHQDPPPEREPADPANRSGTPIGTPIEPAASGPAGSPREERQADAADASGSKSPPPPIDFEDLATKLRMQGKGTQAALVEYMADKRKAKGDDVALHVHGDSETSDQAMWNNAKRTSDSLSALGSPLSFRFASGWMFREISPE